MKEIRLAIAIPSTQSWCADFGMSLVFLSTYLAANSTIDGREMQYVVHNKRGSILATMREQMVQLALDNHATHLLFIDSDQVFPRDLVHRLLAHNKLVVAANITTKAFPPSTTARLKGEECTGIPLFTGPESAGLVEVWRVGTGVMLLDLNLFKREGMEGPWFEQHWTPELNAYTGEDWSFCEKLEAAGVKIWVDQDVSKEIGHIGSLIYNHDMVNEEFLNAGSDN